MNFVLGFVSDILDCEVSFGYSNLSSFQGTVQGAIKSLQLFLFATGGGSRAKSRGFKPVYRSQEKNEKKGTYFAGSASTGNFALRVDMEPPAACLSAPPPSQTRVSADQV